MRPYEFVREMKEQFYRSYGYEPKFVRVSPDVADSIMAAAAERCVYKLADSEPRMPNDGRICEFEGMAVFVCPNMERGQVAFLKGTSDE